MEKSSSISALVKVWRYRYSIRRLPPFLGDWDFSKRKIFQLEEIVCSRCWGFFLWPPLQRMLLPLKSQEDWLWKGGRCSGQDNAFASSHLCLPWEGRFSQRNSLFWVSKYSPTAAKPFPANNRMLYEKKPWNPVWEQLHRTTRVNKHWRSFSLCRDTSRGSHVICFWCSNAPSFLLPVM